MQHSLFRRRLACAAAAVGTIGLVATGCSGADTPSEPVDSQPLSQPAAQPVDRAECSEDPPEGPIDREAWDLSFGEGKSLISVAPGEEGNPTGRTTRCYEFARWGNPEPEVPPDSLLFLFKGAGSDGTQIEFLVGELTGGMVPPVDGAQEPIGPLTEPIPAQVGVSLEGDYYEARGCELRITAMSPERAAGSYSCPPAPRSAINPFAPSDDVTQQPPHLGSEPATPEADDTDTVILSGWFDVTP